PLVRLRPLLRRGPPRPRPRRRPRRLGLQPRPRHSRGRRPDRPSSQGRRRRLLAARAQVGGRRLPRTPLPLRGGRDAPPLDRSALGPPTAARLLSNLVLHRPRRAARILQTWSTPRPPRAAPGGRPGGGGGGRVRRGLGRSRRGARSPLAG